MVQGGCGFLSVTPLHASSVGGSQIFKVTIMDGNSIDFKWFGGSFQLLLNRFYLDLETGARIYALVG
jgi:hypothetical protein